MNTAAGTNTYTIINCRTHEVAYSGTSSSAASRKANSLGANPAGWLKVRGNTADAKSVASRIVEQYPHYLGA